MLASAFSTLETASEGRLCLPRKWGGEKSRVACALLPIQFSNSQAPFLSLPRLRGRVRRGRQLPCTSRFNVSNSQASSARVVVRRRVRLSFSSPSQIQGSGAPTGASTIPRLRGAARVLRRRQVYALCANVHETRSPLGAPPRRFWPTGLLQSSPGPTFRPPDPAGFRLRSSGGGLPTMASPRSRARQHPEAPGDGLRDHPQAPHPLRQSRRL